MKFSTTMTTNKRACGLMPEECVRCGEPLQRRKFLCSKCKEKQDHRFKKSYERILKRRKDGRNGRSQFGLLKRMWYNG